LRRDQHGGSEKRGSADEGRAKKPGGTHAGHAFLPIVRCQRARKKVLVQSASARRSTIRCSSAVRRNWDYLDASMARQALSATCPCSNKLSRLLFRNRVFNSVLTVMYAQAPRA